MQRTPSAPTVAACAVCGGRTIFSGAGHQVSDHRVVAHRISARSRKCAGTAAGVPAAPVLPGGCAAAAGDLAGSDSAAALRASAVMIWFSCLLGTGRELRPSAGSTVAGGPDHHHTYGPIDERAASPAASASTAVKAARFFMSLQSRCRRLPLRTPAPRRSVSLSLSTGGRAGQLLLVQPPVRGRPRQKAAGLALRARRAVVQLDRCYRPGDLPQALNGKAVMAWSSATWSGPVG